METKSKGNAVLRISPETRAIIDQLRESTGKPVVVLMREAVELLQQYEKAKAAFKPEEFLKGKEVNTCK